MPVIGKYLPREAVDELRDLVEALRVSNRFPDAKHGAYWTVYAHPVPEEEGGQFNVLVSIRPKSPQEENRAVGLRLILKGDEPAIRLSAPANHRGQLWFRALEPGDYSAWPFEGELRQLVAPEEASLVLCATPATRSCVITPTDSRLHVVLEASPIDKRATLTVSTQAPELCGATVRFAFAPESGEMMLAESGIPGVWRVTKDLNQTFDDALKCQQAIEVVPAKTEDGGQRPGV